jgi:hypothetical protein
VHEDDRPGEQVRVAVEHAAVLQQALVEVMQRKLKRTIMVRGGSGLIFVVLGWAWASYFGLGLLWACM